MKQWQQDLIPQHLLSQIAGKLASAKLGRLTHYGIKQFIQYYNVNMNEAKITDYTQFKTFNDFFTRELKPGARTIIQDSNKIISPVDGCISEIGAIEKDQLLQAKGAYFSVRDLCGGDAQLANHFNNGAFLTAYLSPRDYHRFHMPITGRLKKMIYIPGKLYSVNQSSVKNVPGLFARNERVVCVFETAIGMVAFIAVGAMIVGSIGMKWHGVVTSSEKSKIQTWEYNDQEIVLQQGDEVGHFRLGSTVILLCEQNKIAWNNALQSDSPLLLGQLLGDICVSGCE